MNGAKRTMAQKHELNSQPENSSTNHTEQPALTLPLARLRWLQEMGIMPAMLRQYTRQTGGKKVQKAVAGKQTWGQGDSVGQKVLHRPKESGAGRVLFKQMLKHFDDAPAPQAEGGAQREPTSGDRPEPLKAVQVGLDTLEHGLQQWREAVQNCRDCERSANRLQVLTGVGCEFQPEWFVLGSMPTRQDESQGKAWRSAAGQLLYAQLKSIGLEPKTQTYCSYALKCRADQFTPSAESIQACAKRFLEECRLVQPKRLLILGEHAVQMVFGPQKKWQQLRGQVLQWSYKEGVTLPVVVGLDPASLLLRPQQKAQAWRDLLLMRQLMQEA